MISKFTIFFFVLFSNQIFAEYKQFDLAGLNSCTDECDKHSPIYREDKDKEKITDFHHPNYQGAVERKITNLECKMKCAEPYRKSDQSDKCYESCGQELIKIVDGKKIRPTKKILDACVMTCTDKSVGSDVKRKLSQCQEEVQSLRGNDSKVHNRLARDAKEIENKYREKECDGKTSKNPNCSATNSLEK